MTAEVELAKARAFIRAIKDSLDDESLNPEPAWFSQQTTVSDAIGCYLYNPLQHGEVPLFVEAS